MKNEVFISYSRKDKEFVQKLHTAFLNMNRDIWVDWEDIPLTADWRQEIYSGIEGAHSFIFIISPDSVQSQVCGEELDHAIKNRKRLIPIVHRDADPKSIHPELARLNWIFFRQGDNFDTGFQQLVEAIDTDLAYVRMHARLQQRALEWEHKDCDRSLLLHGKTLQEAEQWLEESSDKQPEPTVLHSQYLITSSRVQNQRQQWIIGAIACSWFLTTMLGLFAETQRREAVHQHHRARREHVQALIALSEVKLLDDDDLGALTSSVEAGIELQKMKAPPQDELEEAQKAKAKAKDVLKDVLANIEERNRFNGHRDQVNHISLSPDGRWIASASNDRTVKLWQEDGRLLRTLAHNDHVRWVSFSPDNQLLASTSKKTVRLWSNKEGCLTNELQNSEEANKATKDCLIDELPHSNEARVATFAPDSERLVTGSNEGTVQFWQVDGTPQRSWKAHNDAINDVALSPKGQLLATASSDRTVKLWKTDDGTLIQTFKGHKNKVWTVDFSPSGQQLVTASSDTTVKLWNLDGTMKQSLDAHINWVRSARFSPDGKKIVSGSDDDTVKLWNQEGTLLGTFTGHTAGVRSVAFSPTELIVSAGDDNTIRLRNIQGSVIEILQGHSSGVKGVSFSPKAKSLASVNSSDAVIASVSTDDTLKLWRQRDTLLLRSIPYPAALREVVFSPDGKTAFTASYDKTLQRWDIMNALSSPEVVPVQIFKGHTAPVNNLSVSPDSQWVASAGADGTVRLWRPDGTLINTLEAHKPEATDVTFAPDSQSLVSVGSAGLVKVWSLDGQLRQQFQGHNAWINAVAFSSDGQLLATASGDKTIALWQKQQDKEQFQTSPYQRLDKHTDWVWDVAFSPDNQRIASGGKDDTVRLWDLQGNLMTTLSQHTNWVRSVSFSPDGQKLASASTDKTVILWNLVSITQLQREDRDFDLDQLLALGCDWLSDYLKTNRDLKARDRQLCQN